ncbi:MAG: hypothetical protein QOF51_2027, partial [Chloroflexota bacterium]|nr:hypothetical protein [Chloroflexota bacterium]
VRLGVALLVGLLVWPVLMHAIGAWASDDGLSFGFAAPAVAAFLVWWQRDLLRQTMAQGTTAGLLIVVGARGALLLCVRLAERCPAAWAVGLLLWGCAVYLWGWRAGRVLAFPIGFLAFALGLQQTLIAPIAFDLQHITAIGAEGVSRTLGLAVVRDDLVLHSDQFSFVVAEACSGMSSLLALLGLTSLMIYLAPATPPGRVAVLLSVAPLVVVANITRVALVLLFATWFGEEAALGFFHGASSLVLFGVALGGLLVVCKLVGCRVWAAI